MNPVMKETEFPADKVCKRLLALAQYGAFLQASDGHIWIYCSDIGAHDRFTLDDRCKQAGIVLNGKIYHGVLEALDTIDEVFKLLGLEPLLDQFEKEGFFWGHSGPDLSRISHVEKDHGSLF